MPIEKWEAFEDEVASLYKLLGFTVTRRVLIPGQQIDLIAEQWTSGIGPTRLCIECKYQSLERHASITNQIVHDFVAMFKATRDTQRWTAGIIVSNVFFSDPARAAAAEAPDVHVKTINELYGELLKIRAYLHKAIQSIESRGAIADYIALNARALDENLKRRGHLTTLQATYQNWIANTHAKQLCLLADFGSGKTTFLLKILDTAARAYLASESPTIPLYIALRDYYDSPTAEHLMEKFFAKECGALVDINAFNTLLAAGKFLLLLDGYDEMGASAKLPDRKAHYLKLATLVGRGRKTIITCRPAYFPTKHELKAVFLDYRARFGLTIRSGTAGHPLVRKARDRATKLDPGRTDSRLTSLFSTTTDVFSATEFVELQPFDERQIVRYLAQYDYTIQELSGRRFSAETLRTIIRDTYDLDDLASRPLLLKLIVLTLPKVPEVNDKYLVIFDGQERFFDAITPSVLYWLYTEDELRREEEERGPVAKLVSRATKEKVISELATYMYKNGVLALDSPDFQRVVRAVSVEDGIDPDTAAAEIRSCSFLSRDHRDCVRFTHKSFMEYFSALYLCQKLATFGPRRLLGDSILPKEICFFLGDFVSSLFASHFSALREAISTGESATARKVTENCLNTLNYARQPQRIVAGVSISTLRYEKLRISSLELATSTIEHLAFRRSQVESASFKCLAVGRVSIRESEFRNLTLEHSEIRLLECAESAVGKFAILNSEVSFEPGFGLQCRELRATQSVLLLGAAGAFGSGLKCSAGELVYEDCIFYRMDLSQVGAARRVTFRRCVFIFCEGGLGTVGITATDCLGILVDPSGGATRLGKGVRIMSRASLATEVKNSVSAGNWHGVFLDGFSRMGGRTSGREIRRRLAAVKVVTSIRQREGRQTTFVNEHGEWPATIVSGDVNELVIAHKGKKVKIPTFGVQVKIDAQGIAIRKKQKEELERQRMA